MPNVTVKPDYSEQIAQLSPELRSHIVELLEARELLDRFAEVDPLDFCIHLSNINIGYLSMPIQRDPVESKSCQVVLHSLTSHFKDIFNYYRQHGGNVVLDKC